MIKPLIILLTLFSSGQCHAFSWGDLWKTKDQKAFEFFKHDEPEKAAVTFENNQWKGSSHYRSGNYEQAYDAFSFDDSATGFYNRGNALAFSNQVQEAIAHYDEALRLNPEFDNAKFNKELLEQLLQEQQDNTEDQHQAEQDAKNDNQEQSSSQDEQNQEPEQSENQQSQQNNQSGEKEEDKQREDNQESQASEQEQSTEQWLKQIPDDPGGLLKQKFLRDYIKRKHINS